MTMISLQFVFLELLFGFPFHSEDKAVLCWFNIEISHCAKCHLSINHRRQTLVSSPGGHSKLDPNHVMTQTSSSSCACPHVVVFGLEKVGRCFGVLSVAPNWTTIPAPVRLWGVRTMVYLLDNTKYDIHRKYSQLLFSSSLPWKQQIKGQLLIRDVE